MFADRALRMMERYLMCNAWVIHDFELATPHMCQPTVYVLYHNLANY